MEGTSSRSNSKRPDLEDDDESNKSHAMKRVRFPKGKKVKPGDEAVEKGNLEEEPSDLMNPRLAAKERAKRRNQITTELCAEDGRGILNDISTAEVKYEFPASDSFKFEDNENFVDDGIQIEPFNLTKEREEGYFDAEGNFVEYVKDNDIKDAWLDNVEVDSKYAALNPVSINEDEDVHDLSSKDIGMIKRRIADVLQPEETVLQALRRLKGNSDRKAKMAFENKIVFDRLTEDAMKLMENGEYNVYHEKQEVFKREAEGYEKLAQARAGASVLSGEETASLSGKKDPLSDGMDSVVNSATFHSTVLGTSNPNVSTGEVSGNGADEYDMFAEDDEQVTAKPSTDENNAVDQPSSDAVNYNSVDGALRDDYVYDESSGYYYSSSLGYYYDPNTGLFCSAVSGQWYSYTEETGTYDEVNEAASNVS